MQQHIFSEFEEVLQLFIIAAACIGAILTTVFSLTHNITEVFRSSTSSPSSSWSISTRKGP